MVVQVQNEIEFTVNMIVPPVKNGYFRHVTSWLRLTKMPIDMEFFLTVNNWTAGKSS